MLHLNLLYFSHLYYGKNGWPQTSMTILTEDVSGFCNMTVHCKNPALLEFVSINSCKTLQWAVSTNFASPGFSTWRKALFSFQTDYYNLV